ncbi:MAG: hypothetical protein Q4G62_03215 [Pseudomonadota bacterium]|nr:hypothetical protein [Pseudomonadota bacterium]
MTADFDIIQMFLVRYLPKMLLMLLVLGYLLVRILRTPESALGKARPLALTGVGLFIAITLISPVLYVALMVIQIESPIPLAIDSQWIERGYAIVGGVFTLMEVAALLLLGLAVLADRRA